jgi:hypothetical protein
MGRKHFTQTTPARTTDSERPTLTWRCYPDKQARPDPAWLSSQSHPPARRLVGPATSTTRCPTALMAIQGKRSLPRSLALPTRSYPAQIGPGSSRASAVTPLWPQLSVCVCVCVSVCVCVCVCIMATQKRQRKKGGRTPQPKGSRTPPVARVERVQAPPQWRGTLF